MTTSYNTPRYSGVKTFLKAPLMENGIIYNKKINLGILGIPFDSGCTFKTGSRFAPSRIREISSIHNYYSIHHNKKLVDYKNIYDCNDASITPFDNNKAVYEIKYAISNCINKLDKLIIIGGDHSLSYPSIKAHLKNMAKLLLFILIHILIHILHIMVVILLMALLSEMHMKMIFLILKVVSMLVLKVILMIMLI